MTFSMNGLNFHIKTNEIRIFSVASMKHMSSIMDRHHLRVK